MPAPKNPNTAAASEARRRIGLKKAAEKLRAAGWLPADWTPPDDVPTGDKVEGEDRMCGHV